MRSNNDIYIGDNEFISWIDFAPTDEAFGIDTDIKLCRDFFGFLETACLSACCGVGAFEFEPHHIKTAAARANIPNLKQNLIDLKSKLETVSQPVLRCSFMNQLFARTTFIQLLNHIIKNL